MIVNKYNDYATFDAIIVEACLMDVEVCHLYNTHRRENH